VDFGKRLYNLQFYENGCFPESAGCWLRIAHWQLMAGYPRGMSKTIRLLQNAVTEFEAGNFERATTLCAQVIQREPANILALSFGALIEQQRGRHEQALIWIQRAIKLAPADAQAQRTGGAIVLALGRYDEAVAHTRKALELQPNMPGIHAQLGTALTKLERADEAMASLELALRQEQKPDAELLNTVSAALEKVCDFVRAEEFARRSLQRKPDYQPAYNSLGNALLGQGRLAEAIQVFDQALARNPDDANTRYNRSFALLASGDFLQGWADYEARWIRPDAPGKRPAFQQPAWDGREIKGRSIVLYSEQGIGDAIHFIRYVPVVAAMGAQVLLVCPATLHSLVRHMEGVVQLFGSDEPLPAFDTHAPLMSLPYLLKTTLETVPAEVPYLREPPVETFPLSSSSASLKVGLVWAGGDGYRKNRIRSVSLDQLLPVLRVSGVQFYSLQCGSPKSDLMKLPAGLQIEDLGSRVRDFADTAAAMGQLDLVISVCTSTLHLAGALGRPAWGLLSHAPCWRWMLGCSDSPWYPTMKLFRQPKLGDWAGAVAQMESALREAAAGGNQIVSPPRYAGTDRFPANEI
jgi:Tfp pilus assembly protein PilF